MLAEWEQCLGPIAAGLHHLLETSSAFPGNACLVLRLVLRHFGTILVREHARISGGPGNACTKPALVVAAVGVNTCILRAFIPGKPCLGYPGRAQYAGISNTVLRASLRSWMSALVGHATSAV